LCSGFVLRGLGGHRPVLFGLIPRPGHSHSLAQLASTGSSPSFLRHLGGMRFIGIDVASETPHGRHGSLTRPVLHSPKPFTEDASGYSKLKPLLGAPDDALVLFRPPATTGRTSPASLTAGAFPSSSQSLPHPGTLRFRGDLERTRVGSPSDAVTLARLDPGKRPKPTALPDSAIEGSRSSCVTATASSKTSTTASASSTGSSTSASPSSPNWSRTGWQPRHGYSGGVLPARAIAAVQPKALANLTYGRNSLCGVKLAGELVYWRDLCRGRITPRCTSCR
jgi:hypothetical protein